MCLLETEDPGSTDEWLSSVSPQSHTPQSHPRSGHLGASHSYLLTTSFQATSSNTSTPTIFQIHQDLQSIPSTVSTPKVFTSPNSAYPLWPIINTHSFAFPVLIHIPLSFFFLHHIGLVKPYLNPTPLLLFSCTLAADCGWRQQPPRLVEF